MTTECTEHTESRSLSELGGGLAQVTAVGRKIVGPAAVSVHSVSSVVG